MDQKNISLYIAILPVIVLIVLLSLNVMIFKDDAVSGSNQIILIVCGAFAAGLAILTGAKWKELEEGIVNNLRIAMPAILILLLVGALSGSWLISGVVPTMIYYGLHILNPSIFLLAACIICIFVSVFTGSSWTTSATVGIALVGIGKVLGLHPGMIAGAIISGAYFGDKMSPLSDTTNLAAAAAGTELFDHIRYMCFTTIPSILIAMALFTVLGFGAEETSSASVEGFLLSLNDSLNITPWLLLVPLSVLVMIIKKIPAMPALFIGALLGVIFSFIFQPELIDSLGLSYGNESYSKYIGVMLSLFGDSAIPTNNESLNELLTSGGMAGMLTTIWLIICAMIFGGIMESSQFLKVITDALIVRVKSIGALVSATAGTSIFFNISMSDQYLSVLLSGRMYSDSYKKYGLAPKNLSRTIEDSGTVTSALIPWNTCGAYHAGVLGIATLTYLPFAFFCIISPIMTILFAYMNIKIEKTDNTEIQINNESQAQIKLKEASA